MMAKKKAPVVQNVYQLKVTLKNFRPPIWRRIAVADNTTLSQLHEIIQIAMGWENSHLHAFIMGKHPYRGQEITNEDKMRLSQIAPEEKLRFLYHYDFGDDWVHDVLVEKILPWEEGQQYPVCLGGKRACPPEDVGGVWGYAEFLEAYSDPKHPEHENMQEWVGEDFDPEFFDPEIVNQLLKTLRK